MMPQPDPIDGLVRTHLERVAADVDAHAMLARVRSADVRPPRRSVSRRVVGGLSIAIGLAAAVTGLALFNPVTPRMAAAEELLAQAKLAHEIKTDRCYELVVENGDLPIVRKLANIILAPKYRVWTRGDAFWAEPLVAEPLRDGPTYALGQDTAGRTWMTLSRKRGLLYESNEIGEPLTRLCDFLSLRTGQTLSTVLEQFTLFRKDTGRPGEPIRIVAVIRPTFLNRNPKFRQIEIDLNPTTKMIERAAFQRAGSADTTPSTTFILVETADQPDDVYDIHGHLDPDGEILDRSDAAKSERRTRLRDDFLKRLQNRRKDPP